MHVPYNDRYICSLITLLCCSPNKFFRINPFMPNGLFCPYKLHESIHYLRMSNTFIFFFFRCCKFDANSIDPDEIWRSAASGLRLHCLFMTLLGRYASTGLRIVDTNMKHSDQTVLIHFLLFEPSLFEHVMRLI